MDIKIYLLKVSGSIAPPKHKEFEQTIRFVFNMLPPGCFSSHLAIDILNSDLYHFFTMWHSQSDLAAFKNGNEFQMIKGSFHTLGIPNSSRPGKLVEIQTFEKTEADF
jgi:hypothetical protein